MIRLIRLIVLSGAILTCTASILHLIKKPASPPLSTRSDLQASAGNTYFGPTSPVPGNPNLIRVEVLMKDSPNSSGPQLLRVEFYGREIPLKPRDIYGNRGSGSFQIPPGKYKLRWTISRDAIAWPREVHHEAEITISPRDLWLQLEVQGDEAIIS